MKLTPEQNEIINSTGNIKINAVAGSGKTTTVIEYAKTRPKTSKILYLAFNKSVRLEATKKFREKGLSNVKVETAHSLAFKNVVMGSYYKLKEFGYRTNEIADLLQLKGNGEKHAEYIVANHINKFITYFCNSDKQKVQELNYRDTVTDSKAKAFVNTFYDYIESQTNLLLGKMDTGEIEITHDFYLKKFQLSNPSLNYDYILFDEGQDASAAMLDIFLKQKAIKVIVGDTHQQIYGWRYAVNSLERADFKSYNLSTSFRFNQDIADLAMGVLKFKSRINREPNMQITGKGSGTEIKSKAVIARTNLGLLLKAIRYVTEKKKVERIYFEGNINSYTYADEGASLYDVLSLYNSSHHLIKDKLIKGMKDLKELEDYIEKTEDVQLGMMVEIVTEYGNEIPKIIKAIKEKHIESDEKEKAEMIFSTVHRCKGMEYDAIQLVGDFITEEQLEKLKEAKEGSLINDKLNEEINLLYVAITRTKNSIYIPETLMPVGFPTSSQIHVIKVLSEEEKEKLITLTKPHTTQKTENNNIVKDKAYSVDGARKRNKDAYRPWTDELDTELRSMYLEGVNIHDIAKHFGRTIGGIASRIKKQGIEKPKNKVNQIDSRDKTNNINSTWWAKNKNRFIK
jgi:F-box protein 18 (helicase)